MRVLLVRHGQSRANIDHSENARVADHAIELTEAGHEQAKQAGKALAEYFSGLDRGDWDRGAGTVLKRRIRLWHSPYKRTRQTAENIVATCRTSGGDSWFLDPVDASPVPHAREHILLAEQQFGLFDGLSDEERAEQYPAEHSYYNKCKEFEGKMWPKMPLGESRFDVCQRVHQAFGSFHRDAAKHGIKTIVVVGHGTTNRAFVTMWCHKPWEWMHNEKNPLNCSIRLIEDGQDKGYIFDGFKGGVHAGQ